MHLEILYEDQQILVCHKPAGVATETKRIGQQDMVSLLRNFRAEKAEKLENRTNLVIPEDTPALDCSVECYQIVN